MIKYLKITKERLQYSLSILRKIERSFASPETRKNIRRLRIRILLGTIVLMSTPWVFGELIDKALVKNVPYASVLLGVVVCLVILRIRINLATNLNIEKNHGDSYMNTDLMISNSFIEKNIKQLQTEKVLAISNISKSREYINNIIGDLRIGIMRVSTDLLIGYCATIIGAFAFGIPLIALTSTIGLIVALVLSAYLNTKVLEDTKKIEARFRSYNREYEEMIEKFSYFKAQGMDRKILKQNEDTHKNVFVEDRKFWYWYIKRSEFREFIISLFVIVAAYIIGVYRIMQEPDSLPLVIALFSWGGIQAAALRELARQERSLNKRLPSIVSLFEALSLEPLRKESGTRKFNKNEPFDIIFDHISHNYEDGEPVLSNINIKIKSGQKWAIVGESGSGKTTIINLLLGAMPPTQGSISIVPSNGERIDLWDLDLDWWRREVLGYVPQDVVLKDGTLRENLLLAIPSDSKEPTDDDLMHVLSKFDALFRGRTDVSFLDTEVGRDGGIELSGGQRQRIGIVRAVLKNARFFIFDEATSSLDAKITNNVTQAFKEALSPEITSIMIAHDLSTVAGGNPTKLISDTTNSDDLVCTHFLVLRPIDQTKIEIQFDQVDYSGSWDGLKKSHVMRELIHESQREVISKN